MGAYSPAPVLTQDLEKIAMEKFIKPTVAAFAAKGRPYMGALYLGLMITRTGPKLVEYNCRFGDPECQVLMPRLKSDLLAALLAARDGTLQPLEWRDEVALTVVMASKGYPGATEKGHVIHGLDAAAKVPGVTIFHAGTEKRHRNRQRRGGGTSAGLPGRGPHHLERGVRPQGHRLARAETLSFGASLQPALSLPSRLWPFPAKALLTCPR